MAKLHVSITVDWEGEHFRDLDDLHAMREAIQASIGAALPFTHFICPTYWVGTPRGLDPARAIRRVAVKGDELALHVHCWQSLVRAAKVPFISTPDWNNDGTGHGVPLGAYGRHAHALLAYARELLERRLSATVHGFRCGGAMTSDVVYAALMKLGLRYDCSAFPPQVMSRGFKRGSRGNLRDTTGSRNEIAGFLVDLWGYQRMSAPERANSLTLAANKGEAITPHTQPYLVRSGEHSIIEMPGNGAISDYASAGYMTRTFDTLLARASESSQPLFFNIGCHQEGAGRWKKPLMDFCHHRRDALASSAVAVTTVAKAAKLALRQLRAPTADS